MQQPDTAPPLCLLVEDEALIGMDLEEGIRLAGFEVRWAASLQSAFAILRTTAPDVALIDYILRAEPCGDLARELQRLGIPFLVHSGSAPEAGMPEIRDAPWLVKPSVMTDVVAKLALVMDEVKSTRLS